MRAQRPGVEKGINQRRVIKSELDGGYSGDHARSPERDTAELSASAAPDPDRYSARALERSAQHIRT